MLRIAESIIGAHMSVVDAGAEIISVEPGLNGKARTERKTVDIQGVTGAVKAQTPIDLACDLFAQGHGPDGGGMESIGRAVLHLRRCPRRILFQVPHGIVICVPHAGGGVLGGKGDVAVAVVDVDLRIVRV